MIYDVEQIVRRFGDPPVAMADAEPVYRDGVDQS